MFQGLPRVASRLVMVTLALFLAACSGQVDPAPGAINDPYERLNRRFHESSKKSDRRVLRPVAVAYATTVPPAMQESISNFRLNLATPGIVLNDLLQFRAEDAIVNTYRFAVNTVVGLGGLVDVAGQFGVPARETDFGATLHFWRVKEGAYLELPVLGPMTERDLAGRVGDIALNPLGYLLPTPERYYVSGAGIGTRVLDRLGKRGRFAGAVDSVLYDSVDSYAQTRNAYLQKRRYELRRGATVGEDPYAEIYSDPYAE